MKTVREEENLECVFPGSSKMARRTRAVDWAQSALGPVECWPPALRSALAIMFGNPHPMLVWWGRQLIHFCNDSYAERMLDAAQPCPIGRAARILFADAWHAIAPRVDSVIRTGGAASDDEILLILDRNGYPEETYHRIAYAPIPDESGDVAGIACHVDECTQPVLERRRRRLLKRLAALPGEPGPGRRALGSARDALESARFDVPFALVYLLDAATGALHLAEAAGLRPGAPAAPPLIGREILAAGAGGWPFARVMATGHAETVPRLARKFGALPGGAWPEPPHTAVALPIRSPGQRWCAGVLICGVSPRRQLDDIYLQFFERIADSLGAATVAVSVPAFDTGQSYAQHDGGMRDESGEHARIEEALRRSEARLAVELAAMSRLHDLSSRLLVTADMPSALHEVLDAAMLMLGAAMGNIQLYDASTHTLEIVVQRGFAPEALAQLRAFTLAERTVCAAAARSRKRIVVDDLLQDPDYAALHPAALAAGFRGVQATPLFSRDGSLLGVLSTHFRQAHRPSERNLRTLDLYAIQAIDQIERIRAEQALKDADRRKDEFIATLAHELRNPLAPLRSVIDMLRHTRDAGGLERLQQMLERQATHMVRLVDDLLEVSRITTGKIELRRTRLRLADVLANAIETSMPHIAQARHRLEMAPMAQDLVLEGDAVRLEQVFANLLNNAAKYTEDGGEIRLQARKEGGQVVIEVRDSGIGIEPSMLAHVFDMFAQAGGAAGRGQGGLGIGLYLVRRLVDLHGGSVHACSAGRGLGSRFVVRLPLLEAVAPPLADAAPASGGNLENRRRRVLIVDDNRDAAESLGMLLEHFGVEVLVAHDGPAALEMMESSIPDAVLLDIGMPGMDGYAVARRIRAQPRLGGVLLVALSGWGGDEDRRRSRESGFDHHLVKPVDIALLRQVLDTP